MAIKVTCAGGRRISVKDEREGTLVVSRANCV